MLRMNEFPRARSYERVESNSVAARRLISREAAIESHDRDRSARRAEEIFGLMIGKRRASLDLPFAVLVPSSFLAFLWPL